MRFVDLAIDLAAVLSASRGVAAKHAALRSRQLDAYSKTSSLARAVRQSAETFQRKDSNQQRDAASAQAGGYDRDVGAEPAPSTLRHEARGPAESFVGTASEPNDAKAASGFNASESTRRENPSTSGASSTTNSNSAAAEPNAAVNESDVPVGAEVNIFHTKHGSKILESVKKREQSTSANEIQKGGPVREHPMRHWPPQPQPELSAESPSPADVQLEDALHQSDETRPLTEQTLPPTDKETSASEKLKEAAVLTEIAQDLAASDAPSTPAYLLRESTVPASRFSRLWNYGGLAAGMLGGAMTESVSRAFGGGGQGSVLLTGANMERLVAKLSRMRGAALKLGQMMSFQDSKMLPAPIQEVMQRVQDRADYMPAWQRDRVLASNLGAEWRELFDGFEEKPIAAASIGQVHRATLKSNGKPVAVKIQFPGVADSINSDLDNLGILLTATKLLPKGLYLNKTIDNARLELGWECDYGREAECAKRYKELLVGEEDVFQVPSVYPEASGKQVLTMDFMEGVGVTRITSFTQDQRDWIGTQILRLCLREITEFRFMQTDPNWTNFLYNDKANKLELLDFGASREFPREFVTQYVQLLEAASRSDRAGIKSLSESLGYLTGHESRAMLEAHTESIMTLAEPYLATAPEVYDFKDQTITERVKALIPVMLQERLAPPPEETYSLHRKLSGAFLLCARLGSRVRCRDLFLDSLTKTGS